MTLEPRKWSLGNSAGWQRGAAYWRDEYKASCKRGRPWKYAIKEHARCLRISASERRGMELPV